MYMDRKSFSLGVAVSIAVLAAFFLLQLAISPQQSAPAPKTVPAAVQAPPALAPGPRVAIGEGVIVGTGTWRTEVSREESALEPNCIALVRRSGRITFTGVIQNEIEKGHYEGQGLSDQCVAPIQGPFRIVFTLDDVTIAGRKGSIVIEVRGTFTGDVRSPEGVRTTNHLEILGGSGGLEGIKGHGVAVGRATTKESFNNYYIEIEFPRG